MTSHSLASRAGPAGLLLALLAGPAAAAGTDPDWPCVQVRNPEIAPVAVWGGPDLPEAAKEWWKDPDVANAVQTIAPRRTGMEEVQRNVDALAGSGGDTKLKMSALFLGTLERINTERNRIMAGLGRYARKQRAFADRIEKLGDQIEALKAGRPVEGLTIADLPKLQDEMQWDIRIFDERNQSLQYVCESPTLLEQRAFEIARMIAEKL